MSVREPKLGSPPGIPENVSENVSARVSEEGLTPKKS